MNFLPQNNDIMTLKQARELNPLVLAYVGDGVHTLYIRLSDVHAILISIPWQKTQALRIIRRQAVLKPL